VATPGRLWDLITHGAKHLSHLDDLSFFVLDEADRMVQQVRGSLCMFLVHFCSVHYLLFMCQH
jgi:superfamily II DNA/RNA helicase